jgi:hypothetical protein
VVQDFSPRLEFNQIHSALGGLPSGGGWRNTANRSDRRTGAHVDARSKPARARVKFSMW